MSQLKDEEESVKRFTPDNSTPNSLNWYVVENNIVI